MGSAGMVGQQELQFGMYMNQLSRGKEMSVGEYGKRLQEESESLKVEEGGKQVENDEFIDFI